MLLLSEKSEKIADIMETNIISCLLYTSGFDGLVLVPNCDKIVPVMLLGALRINIPTVVCSGGPVSYTHLGVRF